MTIIPLWFKRGKMITFITDKSKGFGDRRFPLYVPGADLTIAASQAFLEAIDRFVRAHLATNDTHFKAEYPLSHEATLFPPHQMFGTEEWQYLIDFSRMRAEIVWLFKNVFDIGGQFGDSGVSAAKVLPRITDPVEQRFFENLFHIGSGDITQPETMEFGEPRDIWFQCLLNQGVETTFHLGDATDYCVRDALKYALRWRQIKHVVLLTDLTSGIYNKNIPGGVGNLEELIATDPVLNKAYAERRLILTTSTEVMNYIKQAA